VLAVLLLFRYLLWVAVPAPFACSIFVPFAPFASHDDSPYFFSLSKDFHSAFFYFAPLQYFVFAYDLVFKAVM